MKSFVIIIWSSVQKTKLNIAWDLWREWIEPYEEEILFFFFFDTAIRVTFIIEGNSPLMFTWSSLQHGS